MRRYRFEGIGTRWNIHIEDALSDQAWRQLQASIDARVELFDRTYSRFRHDSLVRRIYKQPGTYELPKDALPLLTFYEKLYTATGGLVTPLIGAMMVEAGYDELYSFKPQKLVSPPAWQNVLSYDPHSLTVSESVLLDFGAAGKGYLVDLLSQLIEEAGAETYVIDAGGDIVQCSADNASTAIGMENPIDATQVIGKVDLCNQSLCASAGSRRNWGKYHHIIDPQTRCSPSTITATWVIADDTMTADGLATALFFVEPARLLRTFHFEFAVLSADMSLEYSQGFPATLFKAEAV